MIKKIYLVCALALMSTAAFAQTDSDEGQTLISEQSKAVVATDTAYDADIIAARNILNYDPYEKYNRWMFNVNDTVDRNVVVPVTKGYRKVVPGPVRTGARNFFNNLRDVLSFGSNVLRLDIKRASEDLVRFGLNTTFGLGGLIDIAGAAQMPNNKNTLGDTLSSWGWKNSHYFVLPVLGPSTVRDGIASSATVIYPIDRMFINDRGYRYIAPIWAGLDKRESLLDLSDSLEMAAVDRYAYVRDVYMTMRAEQIGLDITIDNLDIDDLVSDDDGIIDVAHEESIIVESTGDMPQDSVADMSVQEFLMQDSVEETDLN